jgi:hypothetical protein
MRYYFSWGFGMFRSNKLLTLSLFTLLLFTLSCNGSSSGNALLTADENSERVGYQVKRCGMDDPSQERVDEIQSMLSARLGQVTDPLVPELITIPVVVHVISLGPSSEEGNISDERIEQQIAVLNSGFAGAQGGVDSIFRFALVGVTRTVNSEWATMSIGSEIELEAKSALRQGNEGVLNMYISSPPDGTLGWATFPWEYQNDPLLDGIVVWHESLPEGLAVPYDEGDTAVHEVGHWLGLFHTFQGGCDEVNDAIADTPSEAIPSFGCPLEKNTCDGDSFVDPVNNFMDYSDDFCLTEYSANQVERMMQVFRVFRETPQAE